MTLCMTNVFIILYTPICVRCERMTFIQILFYYGFKIIVNCIQILRILTIFIIKYFIKRSKSLIFKLRI